MMRKYKTGSRSWSSMFWSCRLFARSGNCSILIVAFVAVMGLYELHSLREYLCGRGHYAGDTWRMVGVDDILGDPNSFAASVNYGLMMLLPMTALARKQWHYIALGGFFSLACLCVFLTGSRTGFAGLGLLLLGGASLQSIVGGFCYCCSWRLPLSGPSFRSTCRTAT